MTHPTDPRIDTIRELFKSMQSCGLIDFLASSGWAHKDVAEKFPLAKTALSSLAGDVRPKGQHKLVYNKQTRTIDKIPVHPEPTAMRSAESWADGIFEEAAYINKEPMIKLIRAIQADAIRSVSGGKNE